jgi:oxaloacetate decarboxylase gamma subunit
MSPFPEVRVWMEGVRLMGVGMTTVFAFLGLLVGVMHLQAALVARWWPEPPPAPPAPTPTEQDDAELAVVLAVLASRHGRA